MSPAQIRAIVRDEIAAEDQRRLDAVLVYCDSISPGHPVEVAGDQKQPQALAAPLQKRGRHDR